MNTAERGALLASQRLNALSAAQRASVRSYLIDQLGLNQSFSSRYEDKQELFETGFSDATIQKILAAHNRSTTSSSGQTPVTSASPTLLPIAGNTSEIDHLMTEKNQYISSLTAIQESAGTHVSQEQITQEQAFLTFMNQLLTRARTDNSFKKTGLLEIPKNIQDNFSINNFELMRDYVNQYYDFMR